MIASLREKYIAPFAAWWNRHSAFVSVIGAVAILLFLPRALESHPPVQYSVHEAILNREVCPGDRFTFDYEVTVRDNGHYRTLQMIRRYHGGAAYFFEPNYIIVDDDTPRPLATSRTYTIPELPPGHYEWLHSTARLARATAVDEISIEFTVQEDCDELR